MPNNKGIGMDIVNLMEQMVQLNLDEALAQTGACDCPQCRMDITALALNNLPPCYVTQASNAAMVRYKLGTIQGRVDIISAIVEAIKKVSENPRH